MKLKQVSIHKIRQTQLWLKWQRKRERRTGNRKSEPDSELKVKSVLNGKEDAEVPMATEGKKHNLVWMDLIQTSPVGRENWKESNRKDGNRKVYRNCGTSAKPNQSFGTGIRSEKVGNNRIKADSGREEQKATGEPPQQGNQKENIRKDVPMQIGIGKETKLIATAPNWISPSGQGTDREMLATTQTSQFWYRKAKMWKGSSTG